MVKYQHSIREGDILASVWGYDQTNVDFYCVKKASACTVTLYPLHSVQCLQGDMVGTTCPGPPVIGKPKFRRKVKDYGFGDRVAINSYEFASKWDGRPKNFTAYV